MSEELKMAARRAYAKHFLDDEAAVMSGDRDRRPWLQGYWAALRDTAKANKESKG